MCGAHILRELQGLVDSGQSKWAKTFKIFLISVYEMPFEERIKRKQQTHDRFIKICNIGEHMDSPPINIVFYLFTNKLYTFTYGSQSY